MCFIVQWQQKPKIAEKDILVYKRLNVSVNKKTGKKVYISPYMEFTYEPSECYFENKAFQGIKSGSINKGLHSYVSRKEALYSHMGQIVVECIIPAGARYVKNSIHCVSDYLIIGK